MPHSFTRYQPQPREKRKVLREQLPTRLRRTINACTKLSEGTQHYMFNQQNDRQEVTFSIYRQHYPFNLVRKLMTLSRVKLKPRTFVINEDNDIDENFKFREALVYSIQERVMSPTNPNTEVLSYCHTREGVFQMPRVVVNKDELGNVENSDIIGWENKFWIPWNNGDSARKIIQEFNGEFRNTGLAFAAESGDSWYAGGTYEVPNLEEWLIEEFDTLDRKSVV